MTAACGFRGSRFCITGCRFVLNRPPTKQYWNGSREDVTWRMVHREDHKPERLPQGRIPHREDDLPGKACVHKYIGLSAKPRWVSVSRWLQSNCKQVYQYTDILVCKILDFNNLQDPTLLQTLHAITTASEEYK